MAAAKIDERQATAEAQLENPYPQGSPDYYLWEVRQAEQSFASGQIKALHFKQRIGAWKEAAEISGIDLSRHSLSRLDPIRRLLADPHLVNHNETELDEIGRSMRDADTLNAEAEALKKNWLELIEVTKRVQAEAKTGALKLSIYVLRCQQTGKILHMSPFHVNCFRVWADEEDRNSLIEGPPSTGKTTCLYGQDLEDMRHNQNLRILRQSCDKENARKRLRLLRDYVENPRYQAIAPHVRIDYHRPCNTEQFTLVRTNPSQDPTVFAAGCLTEYQGSGLERIDCDDLNPGKVQWEAGTRERIWTRFMDTTLKRIRDWSVARVRWICNPWHPADATCRLRKKILSGEMPGWKLYREPRRQDSQGNPLPIILDRPDWRQRRAQLIAQRNTSPHEYACTELLDPQDPSRQKLRGVTYYDVSGGTDPLCPEHRREEYVEFLRRIKAGEKWHVVDPAAGGGNLAGIVGFAKSPRGTAAILSAASFRLDATKLQEEIGRIVMTEEGDKVLIEGQGGSKGQADLMRAYLNAYLGDDFREQVYTSGTRFFTASGTPGGQNIKKEQRHFRALPYSAGGAILYPGKWVKSGVRAGAQLVCVDDPELRALHEQIHLYPNVSQDQYVDCVSLFVTWNVGDLVQSIKSLRKARAEKQERRQTLFEQLRDQMLARRKGQGTPQGVKAQELQLLDAG